MVLHRLSISHDGASIRLGWQRENSAPRFATETTFEHPFDVKALAELRWYLEEYLTFPYGLEPERARRLEGQLQGWGQQLFELVFRGSEKAREFWQEATRAGLDQCELSIVSDDAAVLNLPWELLYAPDYQFLAPLLAGMYRSRSNQPVRAPLDGLPQDRLNILVVIARPYGERDVALRTIARPMLEALRPLGERVHFKVLRPPSFEQFERELNEHKGFYHIVHFDGHGSFDPSSLGRQVQLGQGIGQGQGPLVFEGVDGSPQVIDAARIAQNLANCRVPIFVLNACQSAQEGEGAFSSVATALVSVGATGVVAMAYSVYVEAARQFMGRFYGDLTRGARVASAVASGRRAVLNQQLRPSPKGNLPLQDWLVPVLYQQEGYAPFKAEKTCATAVPKIEALLKSAPTRLVGFSPEGTYGFIGRDYDLLQLERKFRQSAVVLLQGMGGMGKTALACGFARWLDETEGRTGSICFLSFEQGATLSNVVNQVGRAVWGDKFAQYGVTDQESAVLNYLKATPCLLIWDNFELVNGFPAGNEPLLSQTERDRLKQFLRQLRGGLSWVLITSRREETWLDCGYGLQHLKGLAPADAEEFAAQILCSVGVDRATLSPAYLELFRLLGGHSLSLRVVLPHLKTQTPENLIEALRQGLDTFAEQEEEERDKSLTVSLDYSLNKLSKIVKQHLPILTFFHERVYAYWLGILFENHESDFSKAYNSVIGENPSITDWSIILKDVTEAGILEDIGQSVYKIHPSLACYLRQKLAKDASQSKIQKLEDLFLIFYSGLSEYYSENLASNFDSSIAMIKLEEPNLLSYLLLAEKKQKWQYARPILVVLNELYKQQGRQDEFKILREKSLKQFDINLLNTKAEDDGALDYWMYLQNNKANQYLSANKFQEARIIYQEILDKLESSNIARLDDGTATLYNNLGNTFLKTGELSKADFYYHKSIEIRKNIGTLNNSSSTYHDLGQSALGQRNFNEAIKFTNEALKICKSNENLYKTSSEYCQLSEIHLEIGEHKHAIEYAELSLNIYLKLENLQDAATVYHQLGNISYKINDFEKAREYYKQALKIYEDSRDVINASDEYLQLGSIALQQNNFSDADAYYQKALSYYEASEAWDATAITYHQLGLLYYTLGQLPQQSQNLEISIDYTKQALDIRESKQDWYKAADHITLLGMIAQIQEKLEKSVNYYQRAIKIYREYKDFYKTSLPLRFISQILEFQQNFIEACKSYIQAFSIGLKFDDEAWFISDCEALGRMLNQIGEVQFKSLWQETLGEVCSKKLYQIFQSINDPPDAEA